MIATARRDAPVTCPICEGTVERRSRQQRYCSSQCMRRANYARKAGSGELWGHDTARVRNPHKSESKNNSLRAAKSWSSVGIIGPRLVIRAEIISGRMWEEVVSASGVKSYVSRLTTRALREGKEP